MTTEEKQYRIYGHIENQSLLLDEQRLVADSINYLDAKFTFSGHDWDGLAKWAHFIQGNTVYDIALVNDCIEQSAHLNLGEGRWGIYLHGNDAHGMRITTETKWIEVAPCDLMRSEPLPELPLSAAEQISAQAQRAENTANSLLEKYNRGQLNGKNGKDGVSPKLTVGQVSALPSGAAPTVRITGGPAEPKLHFGIPAGAPYTHSEEFAALAKQVRQDAVGAAQNAADISQAARVVSDCKAAAVSAEYAARKDADRALAGSESAANASQRADASARAAAQAQTAAQQAQTSMNQHMEQMQSHANTATASANRAKLEADRAQKAAAGIVQVKIDPELRTAGAAADALATGEALARKVDEDGPYEHIETIVVGFEPVKEKPQDWERNWRNYWYIGFKQIIEPCTSAEFNGGNTYRKLENFWPPAVISRSAWPDGTPYRFKTLRMLCHVVKLQDDMYTVQSKIYDRVGAEVSYLGVNVEYIDAANGTNFHGDQCCYRKNLRWKTDNYTGPYHTFSEGPVYGVFSNIVKWAEEPLTKWQVSLFSKGAENVFSQGDIFELWGIKE